MAMNPRLLRPRASGVNPASISGLLYALQPKMGEKTSGPPAPAE